VMSAVDLGYNVVIVRDGVCGVPREYAEAVLENSLSLLATIASADDVIAAWGYLQPSITTCRASWPSAQ